MLSIVKRKAELQSLLKNQRNKKLSIGFVPTMGALHNGHLSLVENACRENDICVVSIFVNPTQFNDPKDFERYPRITDKDIEKLKETGCHLVYIPKVEDIYENNIFDLIRIDLGILGQTLEAQYRPGHFDGVVTIVKKLFDIVEPHKAYFGQKDYQQYLVIKKMADYFKYNIEIKALPTIREKDGLAMSSRNMLLNKEERNFAPEIYKSLLKAKEILHKKSITEIRKTAIAHLCRNEIVRMEYFEILDADTFTPIKSVNQASEVIICTALKLGQIRLIDNILLKN